MICLIPRSLIALGLLTAVALAEEVVQKGEMRVEVRDGLLSVELGEVPANEVLRTIGEQAGVRVKVQGDLGNVRPQAFQDLPLDKGIRRLMDGNDVGLVMLYSSDGVGVRRLTEIRSYETPQVANFKQDQPVHKQLIRHPTGYKSSVQRRIERLREQGASIDEIAKKLRPWISHVGALAASPSR